MRLRRHLFSDRQIRTLLGNVEEMLDGQQSFVQALQSSVDNANAHESPIGQCFVRHVCEQTRSTLVSALLDLRVLFQTGDIRQCVDYCVHHPLSSFEWTKMKHNLDYANFFEVRRMRSLNSRLCGSFRHAGC